MAKRVLITGNTFPVKDDIKALGGKWDAEAKGWSVPADKASEARALVDGAGARKPAAKPAYRPRVCKACGAKEEYNSRGYAVTKIYKSGECQDCYEERKMGY